MIFLKYIMCGNAVLLALVRSNVFACLYNKKKRGYRLFVFLHRQIVAILFTKITKKVDNLFYLKKFF